MLLSILVLLNPMVASKWEPQAVHGDNLFKLLGSSSSFVGIQPEEKLKD